MGCTFNMKKPWLSFWYFCIPLMPNNANLWDMKTVVRRQISLLSLVCGLVALFTGAVLQLVCKAVIRSACLCFLWRGRGPLKHTSDVINAAKMISESGSRMDVLARLIAEQVSHHGALQDPHTLPPARGSCTRAWDTGGAPLRHWVCRSCLNLPVHSPLRLYQCPCTPWHGCVHTSHVSGYTHWSARAFGRVCEHLWALLSYECNILDSLYCLYLYGNMYVDTHS